MRETIHGLVTVQEHDRRAMRLRRETESIPRRKKQLAASIADHRQAVADSEEALKKGQAAAHDIEVEVGVLRDKIRKMQVQQFEVKSNDDYRVLTSEIDATEERIRTLEDRELEQMERNEELRERVRTQKEACASQEKAIRDEAVAMEERAARIASEIEAMEAERRDLIGAIDPDWLHRYERILHHVGDFGLVPIENGTCGGCHMQLPPQVVQDARRAESISSCAYCGRLLYWR